jgi:demethylmenaquinone methyltransferase/2-methoxy-6-polyprenyl-1,4-benzoquinol methylase
MNRLMTAWQDQKWRRFVVQQARIPANGRALDLATGTGDIAFEALRLVPGADIIGADFSLPMMIVGKRKLIGHHVKWLGADALNLPFSDASFDSVVSGYLFRNVPDIRRALDEQMRIIKPGGTMVTLDSSPPPRNLLRPFILFYLKYVIPLLGRVVVGGQGADAYRYLPESTQAFKTPEELAHLMAEAGFVRVQYKTFMFGTIAVHWGEKGVS